MNEPAAQPPIRPDPQTVGAAPDPSASVRRLVPMAHVADIEASLAFYALLGFEPRDILRDHAGTAFWASASSGKAEIMLTRADGPVDPTVQAVIFYMDTDDVAALRRHLLARGVHDGGAFVGQPGPNAGRRVCFEIARPFYMPAGELRVADPDGYCILIGQPQAAP